MTTVSVRCRASTVLSASELRATRSCSDSPTGRFRGPGCEYAQMPPKVHYDALLEKNGSKTWPAGSL